MYCTIIAVATPVTFSSFICPCLCLEALACFQVFGPHRRTSSPTTRRDFYLSVVLVVYVDENSKSPYIPVELGPWLSASYVHMYTTSILRTLCHLPIKPVVVRGKSLSSQCHQRVAHGHSMMSLSTSEQGAQTKSPRPRKPRWKSKNTQPVRASARRDHSQHELGPRIELVECPWCGCCRRKGWELYRAGRRRGGGGKEGAWAGRTHQMLGGQLGGGTRTAALTLGAGTRARTR